MVWNERQIAEIISAQQELRRAGKRHTRLEIAIAAMPLITIVVTLSLVVMWLH